MPWVVGVGTAALGCPSRAPARLRFSPELKSYIRIQRSSHTGSSLPNWIVEWCGASLRWTAEGGCPYVIRLYVMPKAFYRRKLPHLQRDYKPHFVTFCTHLRWILPEEARAIVLECCLHDNGTKIDLHAVVVMPDHVHLIFTPLIHPFA